MSTGSFWLRCCRGQPSFTAKDLDALVDIVDVQCGGKGTRALETLVEIRDCAGGALARGSLHESWVRLYWWYACGRPRRPRPLPERVRREIAAVIKTNAGSVQARARRAS